MDSPEEFMETLEASHVFLLMKKQYRISRNIRAQWYLKHLNKTVTNTHKKSLDEFTEEIDVISAIPKNKPLNWNIENNTNFNYLVSPSTRVTFLSRCYRLVFCLDLSPSTAAVDIQDGSILFDEVFHALKKSLVGIAKPFQVPESHLLFQPDIYVTIVAHMPFYTLDGQQVLVQGWCLTEKNVEELLERCCTQLYVGTRIVEATSIINEQRETIRAQSDKLMGGLFDDVAENPSINAPLAFMSPDISTVNMLRYGILALQLLPENSSAGIIVITDGMLTLPNTVMLESLLVQLRNHTISTSFLHLGSFYHPFCSLGFVPYIDLMKFIANATMGAFFSCNTTEVDLGPKMNQYHKAFLCWSFQGNLENELVNYGWLNKWSVPCNISLPKYDQPLVKKKHRDGTLQVSLSSILSCRLREGYVVKQVFNSGENLEITLCLPWKYNVSIEYTITSNGSNNPGWFKPHVNSPEESHQKNKQLSCRYEIVFEGTYEFLHDVTCMIKSQIKSPYRSAVVKQFWCTMKNLLHTDQLLVHLQSFAQNSANYTIPDSIKNGLPLFYLTPASSSPDLSTKSLAHSQFSIFWRPICMLDINIWQRWMHTHRIGIVLEHDMPLPKNFHIPNASGRYSTIQYRQSLTSLDRLLREYSSFVLIENHSYIKFLSVEPDKPPHSFFIIRVTSKAPCMVIRLAFLGGMPGYLRNQIVTELRAKILGLTFARRAQAKDLPIRLSVDISSTAKYSPARDLVDVSCCMQLRKPVEKILIKYERVPRDFLCSVQAGHAGNSVLTTNMLTTLSRYLFTHRWIWSVQNGQNAPLQLTALAGILNTIVRLRLQEGFHFAHSYAGIINMVLELEMKNLSNTSCPTTHPCILQYIIFPPHATTSIRDSLSEDGDFETTEADGELQLVMECWIEPQEGVAIPRLLKCQYMEGLDYQQVTKAFFTVDQMCISSLVTFHHLALMCNNDRVNIPGDQITGATTSAATPVASESNALHLSAARSTPDFNLSLASLHSQSVIDPVSHITSINFPFDILFLLPLCQQGELIFSTFIQDLISRPLRCPSLNNETPNAILFSLLMGFLVEFNDREIPFTEKENCSFPRQVLQRFRPSKVYRVPFPAVDNSFDAFKEGSKSESVSKNRISTDGGSSSFPKSNQLHLPLDVTYIPKWRCFVKSVDANHMLITILPASYEDLKLLILGNTSAEEIPVCLANLPIKAVRIVKNSQNNVENAELADESHQTSGGEGFVNSRRYIMEEFAETDDATVSDSNLDEYHQDLGAIENHDEPFENEESVKETFKEFNSRFFANRNIPDEDRDSTPVNNQSRYLSNEINGSVNLPIYCYYCSLPNIISQNVYGEEGRRLKDIFQDLTFKMGDNENTHPNDSGAYKSDTQSSEGSKQPSPEPRSEESENVSDRNYLKKMAAMVESIYLKSFVHGVFRCLQQNKHVASQDIEAVVEGICVESVLEIDIGPFLKDICGHVRDFRLRSLLEQQQRENSEEMKPNETPSADQSHFPVEALNSKHTCEQLKQLHTSIKQQFSTTVQYYFKPIPMQPDFYFFSTTQDQNFNVSNEDDEDERYFSDEPEDEGSSSGYNNNVDIEFAADSGSKSSSSPPKESENGHISSDFAPYPSRQRHSTLHDEIDEDNENESVCENQEFQPLFVHLTCTLKNKNNVGSCSISTLPTCLSEVVNPIGDNTTELDLGNLQITLDVLCLTFPVEPDILSFSDADQRTTSCCSASSPLPEPETTMFSEQSTDYLKELPKNEYDALTKCVEKIKWLLQDEIASATLNSYPLTESILDMVADHIDKSIGSPCCIHEEVPLKFVFGAESSLGKFIQAFSQMTLSEYHLSRANEYYYLVLNDECKPESHLPSSVVPSALGIMKPKLPVSRRMSREERTTDKQCPSVIADELSSSSSSNLLAQKANSGQMEHSQGQVPQTSFIPYKKLSTLSGLTNILETGTTNDEDEDNEKDSRRRGRLRPNRRSSARSSRERTMSPFQFDTPLSFTQSNLNDNVKLVKPLVQPITEAKQPLELGNDSEKLEAESTQDQTALVPDAEPIPQTQQPLQKSQSQPNSPSKNASDCSGEKDCLNKKQSSEESADFKDCLGDDSTVFEETRGRANSLELTMRDPKEVSPSRKMNKTESASSTPFFFSDGDVASFLGNTEDGYEGDSSDTGSEWDWLNILDTHQPILPRFWLFMKVFQDKVSVYFHIRHRAIEDEDLKGAKEIFGKVIKVIKNQCKTVNQTMLLQQLHESHVCHQLLVPEASEDIWKHDDSGNTGNLPGYHRSMDSDDPYEFQNGTGYLEAELKFKPGAFDCSVIWQTHFHVHPRLISGPGRNNMSRGVQALKSILAPFAVSNRKNLFVYQEPSGSVFYFRLQETTCSGHSLNLNQAKIEDENSPLSGSRSSSMHSLHQKKTAVDVEEDFPLADFRPRVNSTLSEKDQSHDSISITSRVSSTKKSQQSIAFHVHGICEAGEQIKELLVQHMQNRLDEAVLDVITIMLARNAKSKLTPEDIQFIQKPGKEPTFSLHFTVHPMALSLLSALVFYLKQNLLPFLHNPNYTDNKMENHFQPFNDDPNSRFSDDDVFLYSRHQASGTSGNKGIACIILSAVDGPGRYVKQHFCPVPSPNAYLETLSELEELTSTSVYQISGHKKSPGPIALLRFQIWSVGKIDVEQLTSKLKSSVQHALWDLIIEFRLLTSPISQPQEGDSVGSVSEPSTPVKVRRTGRVTTEQARDIPMVEIWTKAKTPGLASPTDSISFFKFGGTTSGNETPSSLASSTIGNTKAVASTPMAQPEPRIYAYDTGDRGKLTSVFHTALRPFFEFGRELGVSTIHKHTCSITSRHQVPFLLQQFQTKVNDLTHDILPKAFLFYDNEFLPFNTQNMSLGLGMRPESMPGETHKYIIIGRNINIWRAFMGCPEFSTYLEPMVLKKNDQMVYMYQRFQPYIYGSECGLQTTVARTASVTPTSCLGSPLSTPQQHSVSTPSSLPIAPIQLTAQLDPGSPSLPYIPRQRLLLLFIEDKEMTLYLYNWAPEICTSATRILSTLVDWHNERGLALSSVIGQKLGLFHNQPLVRNYIEMGQKHMKSRDTLNVQRSPNAAPANMMNHFEALLSNKTLALPQSPTMNQPLMGRKSATPGTSMTIDAVFRDIRPPKPMSVSEYKDIFDPVARFGLQLKDIKQYERKSSSTMDDLCRIWKSRDPSLIVPYMDKLMHSIKQVARISHFCLTPILFSPTWRWKVAPVRDHTLEPLHSSSDDRNLSGRSRHNSGASTKTTIETSSSLQSSSRLRRTSGTPTPVNSSPKPRRSQLDDSWHFAICTNYIQEYMEYLQTLGFVAIQTKAQPYRQSKSSKGKESDAKKFVKDSHRNVSAVRTSGTKCMLPVYLIKNLLGGLLVFEVGFCDPYAYGHLYSLESKRLEPMASGTLRSQFTMAFLDELDKIKTLMHLHSFTYDFHLRTIHSYISGRLLLFRQGYHISSFLDDFVKYYQKSPNFARNLISSGTIVIPNTRMQGAQLYDYIISHNELYGMRVVRMVPVFQGSDMDTEYALVELSTYKVSHKDSNDVNHVDNFDVGLLVTYDKDPNHQHYQHSSQNILILKFYILLTSQRELYPKLLFESKLGSFLPVRLGVNKGGSSAGSQPSSQVPSRKTSSVIPPNIAEITSSFTESSGVEIFPVGYNDDFRISNAIPTTMCDEEVAYLGYFSSYETLMLKILNERAETTRSHLEAIVGRAGIHCCRDYLWSCLLPRGRSSDSKELSLQPMSYAEFSELLVLVTSVPLNDIDPNLTPFSNMHMAWYQTLSKVLLTKFPETSRSFLSPDSCIQHVVVTDLKCPDSFMRLTVNQTSNKADLCLVFRKPLLDQDHSPDKPNFRVLALQSLVEDFVNICSFHLWTGLL